MVPGQTIAAELVQQSPHRIEAADRFSSGKNQIAPGCLDVSTIIAIDSTLKLNFPSLA